MNAKLDIKDRKILYELDIDARQSFHEIGRKVGLSKEVVNYRIRRLEQLGVIKGYYTLINMSRLGYMCNRFFIKLKNASSGEEQKIINFFVQHQKYWWVNSIDGFRDIGIASWEKTIVDCQKRKEELLVNFKPYLGAVNQSIYTGFYIYRRAYLVGKKIKNTPVISYITEKIETVDSIDIDILHHIAENARIPLTELAQKLGLTIAIVTYRIKRMRETKVIEGFRAMIDVSTMGYFWYKIEFTLKEYSGKKEMLGYFAVHPNVVYAYESTAEADLEVELEVESYDQFREILADFRTRFTDTIESYRHLLWFKEHKILFFPVE